MFVPTLFTENYTNECIERDTKGLCIGKYNPYFAMNSYYELDTLYYWNTTKNNLKEFEYKSYFDEDLLIKYTCESYHSKQNLNDCIKI